VTPPANGVISGNAAFTVTITTTTGEELPVTVTLDEDDTTANVRVGNDEPKLVHADGTPTFTTVQELADRLNMLLGLTSRDLTFAADEVSIVDLDANTIRLSGHGLTTGQLVTYRYDAAAMGAAAIGGLENNRVYYVVKVDGNTIKLAATSANATAAEPVVVDLTSLGSGDQLFRYRW